MPQTSVHGHDGESFITADRTPAALPAKDSGSFGYHSNKAWEQAITNAKAQPAGDHRGGIW